MTTYAEALARQYNQRHGRNDIEWAVGPNGDLYIRDRFDWTARRTRELEAKAEQERQRWKRAQAVTP